MTERRKITASTKLSDKNNASVPELPSHQKAVAEKRTEERKRAAAKAAKQKQADTTSLPPESLPTLSRASTSKRAEDQSDDHRARRRSKRLVNFFFPHVC